MLSQIYHNGTFRKGKAIVLNSAEIKIVRTKAKTSSWEFSLRLSATWSNYFFKAWRGLSVTDGLSRIASNTKQSSELVATSSPAWMMK